MSSPIVRSTFCPCGLRLHGNSMRMGFLDCRRCRFTARHKVAKETQAALGKLAAIFILERLPT